MARVHQHVPRSPVLGALSAKLTPAPAGRAEKERPWLKLYTTLPPAARQHGEQQAGEEEDYFSDKQPEQPKLQAKQQRRKRPFIYVYDMEPVYTTLMLQVSCRCLGCRGVVRWLACLCS
jgi:hypothetical protein